MTFTIDMRLLNSREGLYETVIQVRVAIQEKR